MRAPVGPPKPLAPPCVRRRGFVLTAGERQPECAVQHGRRPRCSTIRASRDYRERMRRLIFSLICSSGKARVLGRSAVAPFDAVVRFAGPNAEPHRVCPGFLPLLRQSHPKLHGVHRRYWEGVGVWPAVGRADTRQHNAARHSTVPPFESGPKSSSRRRMETTRITTRIMTFLRTAPWSAACSRPMRRRWVHLRCGGWPLESGRWPLEITIARPPHGYEATHEAAMVAFAKSWRRK
jgi:hypothetical protein